jgi:holliday junction DNA helicase RuvA
VIASLSGAVESMAADHAVIEAGGVGYQAFCSARTLRRLPGLGERARLLIETHVREDHIHLYGFIDAAERDWFRLLQSVQGVGAKVALAILSTLDPDKLAHAVAAQDKAALGEAPGVGPKLATRLAVELKDKVPALAAVATSVGDAVPAPVGGAVADAISALVNLGYRRIEAAGAVATAHRSLGERADVGALVRGGLRELAR